MKLLIVSGLSTDTEAAESLKDLTGFIGNLMPASTKIFGTAFDFIQYSIEPGKFAAYDSLNKIDISEFDRVVIKGPKLNTIREHPYYLSKYCRWQKIPFWNDYSLYYPGAKVAQAIMFFERGLPFLKTLFSVDREVLLDQSERELGYPFILKVSTGAHGESNYLVKSRQHVLDAYQKDPDAKFLTQAYCPNDRDYRVLIIDGRPLVFERKGRPGSHLNNTSKGGEAALVDGVLPTAIIEQCKEIASDMHLATAGIDVIPNLETGEYYFLEVNPQPQLRTGAFLEEKQALLKKLLS